MSIEMAIQNLEKLRNTKPLVHNITNVVVTNFTANGLLALGASPVMAYAKEEVAEMAKIASALVLNIGTLRTTEVESMKIAGKSAARHNVPILLDPVGAGATTYRTETAQGLLKDVPVSILRGNAAEIANTIGYSWNIRGVDSDDDKAGDVIDLAKQAALQLNTIVVITGAEDIVSDGKQVFIVKNGHPILTKVTGTGCLLTSVIGAFAAIEKDFVQAAVSALVVYGVAAELAVKTSGVNQPGSFQIELLNRLAQISAADIKAHGSIEQLM